MKNSLIKVVCGTACMLFALAGEADGMKEFHSIDKSGSPSSLPSNAPDTIANWKKIQEDIDQIPDHKKIPSSFIESGASLLETHPKLLRDQYVSPKFLGYLIFRTHMHQECIEIGLNWLTWASSKYENDTIIQYLNQVKQKYDGINNQLRGGHISSPQALLWPALQKSINSWICEMDDFFQRNALQELSFESWKKLQLQQAGATGKSSN